MMHTPEETYELVRKAFENGRKAGLEEAAKVCDPIEKDYWQRWETWKEDYNLGFSHGSSLCGDSIRALAEDSKA